MNCLEYYSFEMGPAVDFDDVIRYHNHYRHKHGSPPLEWDPVLSEHAQAWANYLVENNLLEHAPHDTRPGEGENIYTGYGEFIRIFSRIISLFQPIFHLQGGPEKQALKHFHFKKYDSGVRHSQ